MARHVHKNKDKVLFSKVKVLKNSQLSELLKRDKFEYHIHLDKIPLHLLEDKKILIKLSKLKYIYVPSLIKRLSNKCKSDESNKEIFINLLAHDYGGQAMRYMPDILKNDVDFVEAILKKCKEKKISSSWTYEDSGIKVKGNKKIALLAIETHINPRDLHYKFKYDLDIFKAYIKTKRASAKKYNSDINLYGLDEFDIKKSHLNKELLKLLKEDPSLYEHLSYNHKCIKKNALIAIYNDINVYKFLPKKLKKDIKIIDYVLSRNPDIMFQNLDFGTYKNFNFSELNLSIQVRKYIYKKFQRQLGSKKTDILEIARYKSNILNNQKESIKDNPINSWHFSKSKVLNAISKISNDSSHLYKRRGMKLLENISYELRNDIDLLCYLASSLNLSCEDLNSLKLSKRSLATINKHLFIKRKYRKVSLDRGILKGEIRKYVSDRICKFLANNQYASSSEIRNLSKKEIEPYIKKYPNLIKNFYHEDLLRYIKFLSKDQFNDFIKDPENVNHCKYYMKEIFGESFRKNLNLAKSVIRNWPSKDTCSVIDFNYFVHRNQEFKKFLKNYNGITIHGGDFKSLPMALKQYKPFVENALNGSLYCTDAFKLYKELSPSIKIDPEITDWILAIRPHYAKYLPFDQIRELNTKNIHPSSRKIIYDIYLSKSKTEDVLENALVKKKLLQLNTNNKAA